MMSKYSFPELSPAQIVEALNTYGFSPANLHPEDISSPQPGLLPSVFSVVLSTFDPLWDDPEESQIGFAALEVLENPEHHAEGIQLLALFHKVRDFLVSIRFDGFTLRDFIRPEPRHAVLVLSALINFLHYREDKLKLIVNEFPTFEERRMELMTKIAELNKAISDYQLAAQMEEPMVWQVDAEVKGLKQEIQKYNKQQMALRAQANALSAKKEAIIAKISQVDFELVKHAQENSKLLSKVVQSPEKLQSTLEDKKSAHAKLKHSEKMAMQSVQEKTTTLEMYTKAYKKLCRHLSKVQAIQEQVTAAKTVEKEVKALKVKCSDESVSIKALQAKIVERQRKVNEAEESIKAKEKERDQRLADETHRLAAVRSEMEWKLQFLEPRERKVEAMVAKGDTLCSEADSVRAAAWEKQQELHVKFEKIVQAFNYCMDTVSPFFERVELEKETLQGEKIGKGC